MRAAALILSLAGAALAVPAAADAQVRVGQGVESPADALARNVKLLASSPRDFNALIGAGKAALALGDSQAAAGFFGRAEEAWPASPLPKAGIGAALAQEDQAAMALQYFARAVQLGATASMIGADRGLAYDLLGQHAQAQADYRAALATPPDADEARRRLALSLAITGDKAEALKMLAPLMARGDAGAARCRALVLALTGDAAGARASIEAAMPGSSARMAYFFQKLPTLRSDQKAAAVHLGIFPDSTTQLASAKPLPAVPPQGRSSDDGGDRLASIDDLLKGRVGNSRGATAVAPPPAARQQAAPARSSAVRTASVSRPTPQRPSSKAVELDSFRYWVQLASGSNSAALPAEFRRIRAREPKMFAGMSGYVAADGSRARLLIGPFGSRRDAQDFAAALESERISAFSWISPEGQVVRKLPAE